MKNYQVKEDNKELWKHAESILEKINNGEMNATDEQLAKLQNLIDGHDAFLEADTELKRGMIGLLYERQIYLSKLWLLEKLGVQNKWKHPLLKNVYEILYKQSDDFELVDSMQNQE